MYAKLLHTMDTCQTLPYVVDCAHQALCRFCHFSEAFENVIVGSRRLPMELFSKQYYAPKLHVEVFSFKKCQLKSRPSNKCLICNALSILLQYEYKYNYTATASTLYSARHHKLPILAYATYSGDVVNFDFRVTQRHSAT